MADAGNIEVHEISFLDSLNYKDNFENVGLIESKSMYVFHIKMEHLEGFFVVFRRFFPKRHLGDHFMWYW